MKGFRHSEDRGFSPRTGFPPSPPPAGRRADALRASWQNLREKIIILGENPTFPCRSRPPWQPLAASLLPKGKQRSDLEETHPSSSSSGMPRVPESPGWRQTLFQGRQDHAPNKQDPDGFCPFSNTVLLTFLLF